MAKLNLDIQCNYLANIYVEIKTFNLIRIYYRKMVTKASSSRYISRSKEIISEGKSDIQIETNKEENWI